ncbi:MAG: hypothetical protein AAGI52_17970 [Bacteroidota bacterium]
MRPLALALAVLALPACAQTDAPPTDGEALTPTTTSPLPASDVTTETLRLGETEVDLVTHRHGEDGLIMLNLHDNEDTSMDAALDVLRESGGIVMELRHSGDRNVTFDVDGTAYRADPNRMFTPAGRTRTLGALSTAREEATDALGTFADEVLAAYTALDPAVVITLHNNTDERYSVRSYLAGGDYASDAEAVTFHEGTDPDDFFFITDRAIYDALVARGFNAVLQDNDAATDDGSLSVWAAQNRRPYVNAEAQHDHREEQVRMIRALAEVLEAR